MCMLSRPGGDKVGLCYKVILSFVFPTVIESGMSHDKISIEIISVEDLMQES